MYDNSLLHKYAHVVLQITNEKFAHLSKTRFTLLAIFFFFPLSNFSTSCVSAFHRPIFHLVIGCSLCFQNCRGAMYNTDANNSSLNAKTRGLISSVFRCLAFPKMAGGTTSFPSCYVLIIPLYLASLCFQSFVKLTSHFASNQPRTF